MDLIGAEEDLPDGLDGVSLMPLLRGAAIEPRPIFWHYPHYGNQGGTPGSSLIVGQYKLIEFYEDLHYELYDISTDLSEQNNLINQYPEKAEEMKQLLHQWQEQVCAKFPTVNPDRE